jgi:tryptophan synthase alpha chain
MTRLATTFQRLRASGARALVTYFTAGDPSLEATARLAAEAERRGADVIELGVPFSDPLADGPVIQRAGQRALAAGASLARVLETVQTLRAEVRAPIVLLTYYNPVLAFGLRPFAEAAAKAGVDGVIVADLPPEEAGPLGAEAEPVGLDVVHLAAPTSTTDRLRLIARRSRGFIYLVSLTGVTGERAALSRELEAQVRALRLVTTKPVCVGFGIGRPEQVAAVGRLADGVIVGSAIVRLVEERAGSPTLVADVGDFIAALKAPLRAPGRGGAASTTLSTGRGASSSGHDADVRLPRPPEDTGLRSATPPRRRPEASNAATLADGGRGRRRAARASE